MLNSEEHTSNDIPNYQPHSYASESNSMDQPSAIIGSKIRFKGELVGEEDLIIQGKVDGIIDLKGHNLTVGKDGALNANVSAKTVTIEGSVEGDLFGEEKITITRSSVVKGNIKAARVSLEDGAKFKGSIDMDVDTQDTKTPVLSMPKSEPVVPVANDKKLGNGTEKNKPKLN